MANRTPGPWSVFYSSFKQCPPGCENYASVVRTIQDGTTMIHYDIAENVSPDDADFIVEACNSHDSLSAENARLREALNAAMTATDDLASETYCPCVEEGVKCKCPVYKLYKISAKARAALVGGK